MNLPGGNDGNPPGRTELTPIRLRACCNAYAIHRTPFGRVAPTAWHCCVSHAMLRPANPHIICVAYCHIMRFAIYVTVSDVLVTTSIDLCVQCVHRARFRCPGSPFRLFFEQPGQKHPRKIANSALPHNIRHHTSAEFRASGFAYIERSRDGLSRFPKRGQNHEPGQRNLARFARQSVAVTTGTPTAHR